MRRRLCQFALFVPLLACLLGADLISFDQNYPKAGAGKLEGKGQYTVDPANTFVSLKLFAELTSNGQQTSLEATRNAPNWNATLILAQGEYLSWGHLKTTDKNGNPLNSYTYGLDPKLRPKVTVPKSE